MKKQIKNISIRNSDVDLIKGKTAESLRNKTLHQTPIYENSDEKVKWGAL